MPEREQELTTICATSRPADHREAIIIGGGQAGLATAYYLLRAGVDILVLDDQPNPGGAWLHVWPSLRLFSTAEFSNLPGWPMPPYDGFPPASHVVDYLAVYEQRYRIPVQRPVAVDEVTYEDGIYHVRAGTKSWTTENVVAATGTWSAPLCSLLPRYLRRHAVAFRQLPRYHSLSKYHGRGRGRRELRRPDRRRTHERR